MSLRTCVTLFLVLISVMFNGAGFIANAQELEGTAEVTAPESDDASRIDDTAGTDTTDFGFYEWAAMLGRFHPVVLHFPIGLLMGVFLLEFASVFRRFKNLEPAHWLLLTLATLSSIVASGFGLFLSWEGGYNEDAVFWHQWTGIGVSVLLVLAFILRLAFTQSWRDGARRLYRLALFLSIILISIAGHFGGDLTHGSEYLFEKMPPWMPMATVNRVGGIDPAFAGSQYIEVIKPIFEAKCYECHSEEKTKGDYQMHTRDLLLTPGESELPPIVPGNASKSELVRLIALPEEHEFVMPPEGKPLLTGDEIVAVMQWIDRGADYGDGSNTIVLEKPKSLPAEIDISDLGDDDPVSFEKYIWPIIVASCVECHNHEEQEGELRLDTKEYILEGGEFGPVFEPGSIEDSTFYELIVLPVDDTDFMPAKNDPLPDYQIELIKRWIEEGCDFGDWVGQAEDE